MKKEIQQTIQDYFSDQSFEIVKEYQSKKNTVILINKQGVFLVVKVFHPSNQKKLEKETQILSLLPSRIHGPKLYHSSHVHHLITMEYIPGENLCDLLHSPSRSLDQKRQIIDQLAIWFATFHQWTKENNTHLVKGDAHIRNFIVSDNTVYGVDFEESYKGSPTVDIAECCVSILLTTPLFTNEKIQWCKQLKETYQDNVSFVLEDFEQCFSKSLNSTIKRRTNHDKLDKIMTANMGKINEILLS